MNQISLLVSTETFLNIYFTAWTYRAATLPSARGEQYIIPSVYRFILSAVSQQWIQAMSHC